MSDEIEAQLAENRRLRRDRRLLRERLEAVERSRWWRLHPRRLLGSRRQAGLLTLPSEPLRPSEPLVPPEATTAPSNVVAERFQAEVASGGSFTADHFTHHIPHLDPLLEPLADRDTKLLEVGSYEGLSGCFFLWRLPRAELTCVDTFGGGMELESPGPGVMEARFDANVALVDATRVRKIVGDSRHVLVDLLQAERRFDLVYVDGSHLGLDVLIDGALSWRVLELGGTMIFDDYAWDDLGEDPLLRPGPAIDALLKLLDGKHDVLERGAQLALRKTA